jgi:predicted membrane channel-forming protein YqfA (hemolysin III family)
MRTATIITSRNTQNGDQVSVTYFAISVRICVFCSALYFCWSHDLGSRSCSFDCQLQDHYFNMLHLSHDPLDEPSVNLLNRPK